MANKQTTNRRKLKKKKPVKPLPQGWLSTDDEEIERRKRRAEEDSFSIEALESEQGFFGTFQVSSSDSDRHYIVEINSLANLTNLCDCPDHQINGLGTCKHIEAVLLKLRKGKINKFREAGTQGSPRCEIYLDRPHNQVVLALPRTINRRSAAYKLLTPFFSAEGRLLADPGTALPALQRAIANAKPQLRQQLRFSRHLPAWLEQYRRDAEKQKAKQSFMRDLEQGKRTLDVVNVPLYDYQKEGLLHLAFTERALLADEMGLGKTVQAIAACELLRRLRGIERVLVVAPASLKTEWEEQIAKFTNLVSLVVQGPRANRLKLYRQPAFFYLCNYEQILVDGPEIQTLLAPDVIILDEAQRIKNWQTKTAAAVKRLSSRYAFVLTGTPLENRIDEVYSIAQFLDPRLFGPLFRFNRDFYELDGRGRPTGYKNLDELHRRLRSVMLRRRKEEVEGQLPGRTVNNYYVSMAPEQSRRYDDYSAEVAKLTMAASRRPLTKEEFDKLQRLLACMRMICDTPYILDPDCRECPKLNELENVLVDLLEDYETKILIFSEWTRMLELVIELLRAYDLDFALHTGAVTQQKRRVEINRFKNDPDCRLFLSSDSGSTGLNLQAASVVINLDLPWNPAKLEQRIGRAWRKHQTRAVRVINLVCENSIEHRMLRMLDRKQALADSVLDHGEMEYMEIPSGRQAFIERVEGLMGRPATSAAAHTHEPASSVADAEQQAPTTSPLERLKEDTLARLNDRLDQLHVFDHEGERTVMAVVDKVDETARDVVQHAVASQASDANMELLDRETFAVVQRLIQAGIIQFTEQGSQALHQSEAHTQQRDQQREHRLRATRKRLADADRQRNMAGVLAHGGFPVEALKPLHKAVEITLEALGYYLGEQNGTAVSLEYIETKLLPEQLLPQQATAVIARLRSEEGYSESQAQSLLADGEALLSHAGEALDRETLVS